MMYIFLLLLPFLSNRGCLTQYLGALDQDWTSFSDAIQRLMTLVRSKDGIETVIKALDGKLSEAIMAAMENGPELEKKVSHSNILLLLLIIIYIYLYTLHVRTVTFHIEY